MSINYILFDEVNSTSKWAEDNIEKLEGVVSIITKKQTSATFHNAHITHVLEGNKMLQWPKNVRPGNERRINNNIKI